MLFLFLLSSRVPNLKTAHNMGFAHGILPWKPPGAHAQHENKQAINQARLWAFLIIKIEVLSSFSHCFPPNFGLSNSEPIFNNWVDYPSIPASLLPQQEFPRSIIFTNYISYDMLSIEKFPLSENNCFFHAKLNNCDKSDSWLCIFQWFPVWFAIAI